MAYQNFKLVRSKVQALIIVVKIIKKLSGVYFRLKK